MLQRLLPVGLVLGVCALSSASCDSTRVSSVDQSLGSHAKKTASGGSHAATGTAGMHAASGSGGSEQHEASTGAGGSATGGRAAHDEGDVGLAGAGSEHASAAGAPG